MTPYPVHLEAIPRHSLGIAACGESLVLSERLVGPGERHRVTCRACLAPDAPTSRATGLLKNVLEFMRREWRAAS
jgi:hypothetical protein